MNYFRISILCLILHSSSILAQAPNWLWAKSMGGTNFDGATATCSDDSSNVYLTGSFQGTADFDPDTTQFNLTSTGAADIFVVKLDSLGNFIWAKSFGGIETDIGANISTDVEGAIYISGQFDGSVDFNSVGGNGLLTAASSPELFILKLSPSGNFDWVKQLSIATWSFPGWCVAVSDTGNITIVGCFNDTVDFDPGSGVVNLFPAGQIGSFILKLDKSGNFLWAKQLDISTSTYGYFLALDDSENVYASLPFFGTVDFDPGSGIHLLSANVTQGLAVLKLNSNGNFVWVYGVTDATNGIVSRAVAVDKSGNVFIAGTFSGTVDFLSGVGNVSFTSASPMTLDGFVMKVSNQGNFSWAKTVHGPATSFCFSIGVDTLGNVYTTGVFYQTVDFDPGPGVFNLTYVSYTDIFILKLNSTGNFVWAQAIGGLDQDNANSLVVLPNGDLQIAGYYHSPSLNFGANTIYNVNNVPDIFVARLSELSTGIPTLKNENSVFIYPNPASELLSLTVYNSYIKGISLINSLGEIIYETHPEAQQKQQSIDTAPFPNGIYFVRIESDKSIENKKLIIHK